MYPSRLPHDDCPAQTSLLQLSLWPLTLSPGHPLLPPIEVPESCQSPCPPHLAQGTGYAAGLPPHTLGLPLIRCYHCSCHHGNLTTSLPALVSTKSPGRALVIPALGRIHTTLRPVQVKSTCLTKRPNQTLCHANAPISKVCPQDDPYSTGPDSLQSSVPHRPSHSCSNVITYAWPLRAPGSSAISLAVVQWCQCLLHDFSWGGVSRHPFAPERPQ